MKINGISQSFWRYFSFKKKTGRSFSVRENSQGMLDVAEHAKQHNSGWQQGHGI